MLYGGGQTNFCRVGGSTFDINPTYSNDDAIWPQVTYISLDKWQVAAFVTTVVFVMLFHEINYTYNNYGWGLWLWFLLSEYSGEKFLFVWVHLEGGKALLVCGCCGNCILELSQTVESFLWNWDISSFEVARFPATHTYFHPLGQVLSILWTYQQDHLLNNFE